MVLCRGLNLSLGHYPVSIYINVLCRYLDRALKHPLTVDSILERFISVQGISRWGLDVISKCLKPRLINRF